MNESKEKVACFGEVLWDILPSGTVPGGAPMNVAYHLHQHRIPVTLITQIGDDEPGRAIKSFYAEKGMDTGFFDVDPAHETGKVYATAGGGGNMTYDIVQPVAWDFISADERKVRLVSEANYFVYGSLASRSSISQETLLSLLEVAKVKVMDVNLRPPHYSEKKLTDLMKKATILKVNEDELALIGSWFGSTTDRRGMVQALSDRLGVHTIVVTLGAAGALLYMNEHFYDHPGYRVQVADTVGSGDAFLAGMISQLIAKRQPAEILDYASRLGALVATKKGGCPPYDPGEINKIDQLNA